MHSYFFFHSQITHTSDGGYPCGWCGKIFAKPELLRRHELIHTEADKTLWPCPKCSKSYSNKYNLAVSYPPTHWQIQYSTKYKKAHFLSHCLLISLFEKKRVQILVQ